MNSTNQLSVYNHSLTYVTIDLMIYALMYLVRYETKYLLSATPELTL